MSAITHRAAVARLKTFEADLHNFVKAIAEGRRIDALIQMTLAEMAMLISCLETPADPTSADVHYQSARAAAEADAHDAFERAGGERPQPQPVTREEFDRLSEKLSIATSAIEAQGALIAQSRQLLCEVDNANKVLSSRLQKLECRVGQGMRSFCEHIMDLQTELENVLTETCINPKVARVVSVGSPLMIKWRGFSKSQSS